MYLIVLIVLAVLVHLVCIIYWTRYQVSKNTMLSKETLGKTNRGTCTSTCSKEHIDDVNNPAYNVRLTIENALLIEDHLANKRRYCKPCLTKHLLLQHSYLMEAVWMAGKDGKNYPQLQESEQLFNDIFEKWRKNMDDDDVRLDTLEKIRKWRQDMIGLYYFDAK